MNKSLTMALAALLVASSVTRAQQPSRPAEIPRYAPAPSVARAAPPATASAAPSAAPSYNPGSAPSSAPAARTPRIGYAAEPSPPPQPVYQTLQPSYYYYSQNGYVITGPSYLVLTDGSVAVNFGSGYERVLRTCAALQPAVASNPWGRDALGRIPEPPGIAAMRIGARGQAYGTAPAMNSVACYRSDAQGRVEVVTFRQ